MNYTLPETLAPPLDMDRMLMQTPYEDVLAALVLDTKLNLRFIRTGNPAEGARVALVNVEPLLDEKHWDVTLAWDADGLSVSARGYS